VSAKTTEKGDQTEKVWPPEDLNKEGAIQVFHLKCDDIDEINKIISIGEIKQ